MILLSVASYWLGVATAERLGGHLGMEFAVAGLPRPARRVADLLRIAVILGFLAVVVYSGSNLFFRNSGSARVPVCWTCQSGFSRSSFRSAARSWPSAPFFRQDELISSLRRRCRLDAPAPDPAGRLHSLECTNRDGARRVSSHRRLCDLGQCWLRCVDFFSSLQKIELLAIPFFILAGNVLDRCGIMVRLFALIDSLVGQVRGSTSIVASAMSVVVSGLSGSGPADTAALGSTMGISMEERGYAKPLLRRR